MRVVLTIRENIVNLLLNGIPEPVPKMHKLKAAICV